jgi:high-affinity Fe2+/Pb2+ permease
VPFDAVAVLKQFGLRTLIILVLGWYVLIHQDGQIKALITEAQITNIRLMSLCVEMAGSDVAKVMGCMATSTAPVMASAK